MSDVDLDYARPGPFTDPGRHAAAATDLPGDLDELVAVVQGLLIHPFLHGLYGLEPDPERLAIETQLRSAEDMLTRVFELDAAPLRKARPPEQRLIGNCRHYTTLLCALLRHQGVSARARCGFGAYFRDGYYEDHWVAEVRDPRRPERWRLVDAQLDTVQLAVHPRAFDPTDVPRYEFIVAGAGWQLARSGALDPQRFGLSVIEEGGAMWIASNLVRDVAALAKRELLPWDSWGLMLAGAPVFDRPFDEALAHLGPERVAALDELAAATAGEVDLDGIRAAAADPGWRVPDVIIADFPKPERIDIGPILRGA